MRFTVTWRHADGSLVEFSETGWKSADTEKSDWLTRMSNLCSTVPTIPPVIKQWLEENCELVEVQGSPDLFNNKPSLAQRENDLRPSATSGLAGENRGPRNSSKRHLQLAKRRLFGQFIFLRGMLSKEHFEDDV